MLIRMRRILGFLVMKDARRRIGILQQKEGNLLKILCQSHHQKAKRNVEGENVLQIAALPGKTPQKLKYTQRRERNMVIREDEMILRILVIHLHPMEAIQITHNMSDLK